MTPPTNPLPHYTRPMLYDGIIALVDCLRVDRDPENRRLEIDRMRQYLDALDDRDWRGLVLDSLPTYTERALLDGIEAAVGLLRVGTRGPTRAEIVGSARQHLDCLEARERAVTLEKT